MQNSTRLILVKLLHTAAWAFFAGCILLLPVAAFAGYFGLALVLISLVIVEILILLRNRWACPLTNVAARYTSDRHPGFDIYLPAWLAQYNKLIFGSLFILGLIYTALKWWVETGRS
ncbi:MAG: hypothetical protein EA418_09455 [Wenzhouxiangellaceae bacterium]|nr:MAG: hypothetical protein EA418_09455 [Wenzhouxiangellaceae bacterium]